MNRDVLVVDLSDDEDGASSRSRPGGSGGSGGGGNANGAMDPSKLVDAVKRIQDEMDEMRRSGTDIPLQMLEQFHALLTFLPALSGVAAKKPAPGKTEQAPQPAATTTTTKPVHRRGDEEYDDDEASFRRNSSVERPAFSWEATADGRRESGGSFGAGQESFANRRPAEVSAPPLPQEPRFEPPAKQPVRERPGPVEVPIEDVPEHPRSSLAAFDRPANFGGRRATDQPNQAPVIQRPKVTRPKEWTPRDQTALLDRAARYGVDGVDAADARGNRIPGHVPPHDPLRACCVGSVSYVPRMVDAESWYQCAVRGQGHQLDSSGPFPEKVAGFPLGDGLHLAQTVTPKDWVRRSPSEDIGEFQMNELDKRMFDPRAVQEWENRSHPTKCMEKLAAQMRELSAIQAVAVDCLKNQLAQLRATVELNAGAQDGRVWDELDAVDATAHDVAFTTTMFCNRSTVFFNLASRASRKIMLDKLALPPPVRHALLHAPSSRHLFNDAFRWLTLGPALVLARQGAPMDPRDPGVHMAGGNVGDPLPRPEPDPRRLLPYARYKQFVGGVVIPGGGGGGGGGPVQKPLPPPPPPPRDAHNRVPFEFSPPRALQSPPWMENDDDDVVEVLPPQLPMTDVPPPFMRFSRPPPNFDADDDLAALEAEVLGAAAPPPQPQPQRGGRFPADSGYHAEDGDGGRDRDKDWALDYEREREHRRRRRHVEPEEDRERRRRDGDRDGRGRRSEDVGPSRVRSRSPQKPRERGRRGDGPAGLSDELLAQIFNNLPSSSAGDGGRSPPPQPTSSSSRRRRRRRQDDDDGGGDGRRRATEKEEEDRDRRARRRDAGADGGSGPAPDDDRSKFISSIMELLTSGKRARRSDADDAIAERSSTRARREVSPLSLFLSQDKYAECANRPNPFL